ncbi:uncharacterized protein [Venturia canescens]|uniref:uncharacterized protein n=1 Tax=Venturia canescens TaxID=32260 RepID=UPI001C9BC529|nr:uncharacterized protein LOC122408929 [Venturia canescens]
MGWSRRGNGRSYNSLNGYGAIIGFLSGKVLDFATRSRKCKRCDSGITQEHHDSRLNFTGSAKAMEASVGAELVNNSTILKEAKLNVRVLIGDDDSSTIAAVQRGNPETIFKLSDMNHLRKHFLSKTKVKQRIWQLPYAIFLIMFLERTRIVDSGVADPKDVTSFNQSNESLNNIMAHKALKNQCYSLSESADYRMASSVIAKNDGEKYILNVREKLSMPSGIHASRHAESREKIKQRRIVKARLPSTKIRRNLLSLKRDSWRKKKEEIEGVQYQSNCGMDLDTEDLDSIIDSPFIVNDLPTIFLTTESCNIIFFDLETSGLASTSDILQIAAKLGEHTCNIYITPTQPVDPRAFMATGLQNVNGKLYCRRKQVNSVPLTDALIQFQQFLNLSSMPCILVAHNCKFDSSLLLKAIIHNSMVEQFAKIAGFCDSLNLLKKRFPNRKGKGLFKLEILARDLLQVQLNNKFHEATYDVQMLEQLTSTFLLKSDLIANCKDYKASVSSKLMQPHLSNLKNVVSPSILNKLITARLTYGILKKVYAEQNREGIAILLSKKDANNKTTVTKDKRARKRRRKILEQNAGLRSQHARVSLISWSTTTFNYSHPSYSGNRSQPETSIYRRLRAPRIPKHLKKLQENFTSVEPNCMIS